MSLDLGLPLPKTRRAKAALFSSLGAENPSLQPSHSISSFVFTSKRYPKSKDAGAHTHASYRPRLDPRLLKAHASGAIDSELFTQTMPGFTPFACLRFTNAEVDTVHDADDEYSETSTMISDGSEDTHCHSEAESESSVDAGKIDRAKWTTEAMVHSYMAKKLGRSRGHKRIDAHKNIISEAFVDDHIQCI